MPSVGNDVIYGIFIYKWLSPIDSWVKIEMRNTESVQTWGLKKQQWDSVIPGANVQMERREEQI